MPDYSSKSYDSSEANCSTDRMVDASKLILLKEYESLVRTIEPTRILNRVLLIAMVLVQLVDSHFTRFEQIPLLIATALASGFWFLQELSAARRLNRLGELIASTTGELNAKMKGEHSRPVILPPLKTESGAKLPVSQVKRSTEASDSSLGSLTEPTWTKTYINWRNDAGRNRGLQKLQRVEPIIWFVSILAFEIYRVFSRH